MWIWWKICTFNFLLGKYIFGCFDNSDSKNKYKIILEWESQTTFSFVVYIRGFSLAKTLSPCIANLQVPVVIKEYLQFSLYVVLYLASCCFVYLYSSLLCINNVTLTCLKIYVFWCNIVLQFFRCLHAPSYNIPTSHIRCLTLTVPSHRIWSAWKWYGWIGLVEYKNCG